MGFRGKYTHFSVLTGHKLVQTLSSIVAIAISFVIKSYIDTKKVKFRLFHKKPVISGPPAKITETSAWIQNGGPHQRDHA